jgi:hypothetical protein
MQKCWGLILELIFLFLDKKCQKPVDRKSKPIAFFD